MLEKFLLKLKKKLKKKEIIRYTRHINQNNLEKEYFQHYKAYRVLKELPIKTASDEVLQDKVFNIAKNSQYDIYQRYLVSVVYIFFDKTSASGAYNSSRDTVINHTGIAANHQKIFKV